MKNHFTFVFCIALNLGIAFHTSSSVAAPIVMEKVIAVVNKDVILESELVRMITSIKMNVPDASQLPADSILRKQNLERLIVENLILQEAQNSRVYISDQQLDSEIESIAREYGISVNELRANLAASGMPFVLYQDRIRKEMLMEEVRNRIVRDRISISPQEVDALTAQLLTQPTNSIEVELSQLFLPLPENPSNKELIDVQALVKQIMTRLNQKANFSTLATTYSKSSDALEGGKMGWVRVDELPNVFAESFKSQTLRKNQVIGPIRSGAGFHIFYINNVRGSETMKKISATEMQARHILLKSSILTTPEELKVRLDQYRKEILDGSQSFEALAIAYSEDPGSSTNGGDLGWNMPDRFDVGFRDALVKLNVGELSQPIQSTFGWHLIQLVNKRDVDYTESAMKDQAYRMIFNKKFTEEVQNWMQELRAGAYVDIVDEALKPSVDSDS